MNLHICMYMQVEEPCTVIDLVVDANCVLQLHEMWTLLLALPATTENESTSFGYNITSTCQLSSNDWFI